MSTFNGIVEEFPDIRIDYFRTSSSQTRPPLAYFLSHVHSDHLNGLESCKSPFIYCSPATRDILLRLEKYPHRMNFSKGILESRKQTYRHLKTLLKAIPLETPTTLELSPGKEIQVTLFDANHCVGAVMFLIEGDGKAILYTGDIRSELWWVNSLTRHPLLLQYLQNSKTGRRLDCLYLDTTFVVTGREDPYRHFPSKAEGLKELLQKVCQYPKDTLFYFDAWTFGYEDVWQALSSSLESRIHLDDYRYGLYLGLANGAETKAPEAQKIIGFYCGNHFQGGCVTSAESRVHSCEKGTGCDVWSKDFVRITPIVTRYHGVEMAELGAGGGQGDLNQQHELEVWDAQQVGQLMAMCATKLQGQTQLLSGVLQMLTSVIDGGVQTIALEDFISTARTVLPQAQEDPPADMDDMPLEKIVPLLARVMTKMKQRKAQSGGQSSVPPPVEPAKRADGLPKRILTSVWTFPYSRHSSYDELCYLVEALKPKNIYPCTVDEANWNASSSMSFLFGHIYETPVSFRHDQMMLKKQGVGTNSSAGLSGPGSFARAPGENSPSDGTNPSPKAAHGMWVTESESRTRRKGCRDGRKQRQVQGDYWPPLAVDHYSPLAEKSWGPAATAPPLKDTNRHEKASWPALTQLEATATSPVRNRWHKRIAESRSPDIEEVSRPSSKRGRQQHSVGYGRLSPPPTFGDSRVGSEGNQPSDCNVHEHRKRRKAQESSPIMEDDTTGISLPFQTKMALRKEAYTAALGSDGYDWSEIGLVSVHGHQLREDEL